LKAQNSLTELKKEEKTKKNLKAQKTSSKQTAYEGLDQGEIEQIQKDLVEAQI